MLFDIQINVKIEADHEWEAEELISDVMNETVTLENKLVSWEYVEYVSDDSDDDIPF